MNTQEQKTKTSKLAIMSLIVAILGVFILPPLAVLMEPIALRDILVVNMAWLPPLFGVVFAIVASSQINRAKGSLRGRGVAITGLVLSIFVLLILTLLIVFFIKQYNKSQVIRIEDVTKKTSLTLLNQDTQRHTAGIVIYITGYIDGSAAITIATQKGHESDKYHITKGKVRLKHVSDWYEPECFLEYEPADVQSGFLTLKYYFISI